MTKSAKQAAAETAATFVQSGMTLGLGTGSTANFFIEAIAARCKAGLTVQAVASSQASLKLAEQLGIPLADMNQVSSLDLTVDGADEIDSKKRMIKGGGGALLREKIVAAMSREMVVIVDSSKCVKALGAFPLPVEVFPFGFKATLNHLHSMGYKGKMRLLKDGARYVTDNGNYIYDIALPYPCQAPEEDERKIRAVPGVLETGFFLNMAGRVVVGYQDGKVEIQA